MTNVLESVKGLHDLGFAIHLLKPKSKRPIDLSWTKGPRKSWVELEAAFRPGMNVGVRLGEASKVGEGYLAVIDVDVKSTEKKHQVEVLDRLSAFVPASILAHAPVVMSGRGNGSHHIYILTKEPIRAARLAQSAEKVQVFMPSVQPTKLERELLRAPELAAGMRLRAGWEISLMGNGQQVVLPPSIHPDSGRAYCWTGEWKPHLLDVSTLCGGVSHKNGKKPQNSDFKFVAVDLVGSELESSMVNMITNGEGATGNFSDDAYFASEAMVKAGFSEIEVVSVLTDRENYLGEVGFKRRGESRVEAAKWVRDYCYRPAFEEFSAEKDFAKEVETVALDGVAARAQEKDLLGSRNWREGLERNSATAPPRPSLHNIRLILENEVGSVIFKRNLFLGANVYDLTPPWNDAKKGDELRDIDVVNMVNWIVQNFRFEAPEHKIRMTIDQMSSENPFHPVRDFLDTLQWDGVPRIDSWLKTYLGAQAAEPYLSAISRKILCAMIARVMNPGCKFDQVLILEGKQGIGKSTAARILADPWFSDAHINIADKDATLAMRSIWVMEMGELSGMRKADADQLKEFVSRQTDRIRLPYGRLAENFPRQCVFIGTTNSTEYLKDMTGNRRFWPVKVGKCNLEKLAEDKNQLLAEARVFFELGEPLFLETKPMMESAALEQEHRVVQDTWVDILKDFFAKQEMPFMGGRFTVHDLFQPFGPFQPFNENRSEQMRATECLRVLGFVKTRERDANGQLKYFWELEKGGLC